MQALTKFKRVAVAACAVAAGLFAQSAKAEMTSYWAWDATKGIVCAQEYKSAMVLGTDKALNRYSDTTLSAGWYVVKGDLLLDFNSYGNLVVEENATVNLILADDASLTMIEHSLIVPYGTTLNIYGQKKNTGRLTVDLYCNDEPNNDESLNAAIGGWAEHSNGAINIHGGVITAKGYWGAGIGAGGAEDHDDLADQWGDITVYGGVVKSFSRKGAGIGGGTYSATFPVIPTAGWGNGAVVKAIGGIVAGYASGNGAGIGGGHSGNGGDLYANGACIVGDSMGPWNSGNPAHGIGWGYFGDDNGSISVDRSVKYTIKYGDYEDADWSGTLTEAEIETLLSEDNLEYNVYYFGWKHAITLNPAVSGQHLDIKWALVNPDGSVGKESNLTKVETVYAETIYPKSKYPIPPYDNPYLGFPEGVTISNGVQVTYSCQSGYKFPDGSQVKIVYIHPTRVRGDIVLLVGGSGVYDVPMPVEDKSYYKLSMPPVANAKAKVVANGEVVTDLTKIESGTQVTVIWEAAPGYRIVSGAVETFIMDKDRTVAAPVVGKGWPVVIIEPTNPFVVPKSATVVPGVILDTKNASVLGIAQLTVGKASRKGESSIKLTLRDLDGKKKTSKSVKASSGLGLAEIPFVVKGYDPIKLTLGADGFIGFLAENVMVVSVKDEIVTGPASATFVRAEGFQLDNLLEKYLPTGIAVQRTAKKWTLPKAGKLKYVKPNEKKDIVGGLTPTGENIAGLKLSYSKKNCTIKGSFKLWTLDMAKGKLKSASAKVTGVVIDGMGFSHVTYKKAVIGALEVK